MYHHLLWLPPHLASSVSGRNHSISCPFQEQVVVTSRLFSSGQFRRQVAPSDPSSSVQVVSKVPSTLPDMKTCPEFCPVHWGLVLPHLIGHFSTRVLLGQVRPVLGGGDGTGGGTGDGTGPTPLSSSSSQTTSRSPSLKQYLDPGLSTFSKTQLLLQPYLPVSVSSTSTYDTPPTLFSLQHSGILAPLVYPTTTSMVTIPSPSSP